MRYKAAEEANLNNKNKLINDSKYSKPALKSRNKERKIGFNNQGDNMFFNSNRENSPGFDSNGINKK